MKVFQSNKSLKHTKICMYIRVTFKDQVSSCEEIILIRTERAPYTVKRVKPELVKC